MGGSDFLFRWMFHEITRGNGKRNHGYTVREESFRESIRYVESAFPGKTWFTFDDGHRSDIEVAIPALEEASALARGYFFVTTGWIGREGYLSKRDVADLAKYPVSIGVHGETHNYFDEMDDSRLTAELKGSKSRLEDITGRRVEMLSVPGGRYDHRLPRVAEQQGFRRIFSSDPWDKANREVPLMGRMIMNERAIRELPRWLGNMSYTTYRIGARHCVKIALRKILGNERYHEYWKRRTMAE
jgi:peptidoglycan/xylan/chitin deacetylase (PgdA/CDA1 family)